jgi:hypothetical protein
MNKADRFDPAQACINELLDERHLAFGSDCNRFVLQSVARAYLDKLDCSRSARPIHCGALIHPGAGMLPLAPCVLKICFTMEAICGCDANLWPAVREALPSWHAMTAI